MVDLDDKFYDEYEGLCFEDVLIRPKISELNSRSLVNLEREFNFSNGKTWKGVPIIAANMATTGCFEVYKVLSKNKILTAFHKFYTIEDYKREENLDPNYFMVSTGITDNDYKNLVEILEYTKCRWICIDVANGYIEDFIDFCCKIREEYSDKIILAGNVATYDGADELLNIGIDIVKVGLGSGSACKTRDKTGVGVFQVSALLECRQALVDYDQVFFLCSDGGIKTPGDVSKALGAGADFVMIGGLFAGHDENPGEVVQDSSGLKYKLFYGMSSQYAMEKHYGGMEKYRTSEGAVVKVEYKGPLQNTVDDILGGLRSTGTYINARTIADFYRRISFSVRRYR
jgi:GMP reductase